MKQYSEIQDYLIENPHKTLELIDRINSINGNLNAFNFTKNDEEHINAYFPKSYDLAFAINYGKYNFNDDYFYEDVCGLLNTCNFDYIEDEIHDNIGYIEIEVINLFKKYPNYIWDQNLLKLLLKHEKENNTAIN